MPKTCLSFSDSLKDPEAGVSETVSGREEGAKCCVGWLVGVWGGWGAVEVHMCLCWGGVGSLHTGIEKEAKNKFSENSALMAVL